MAVLALVIGTAWAEGAPAAGGPEKVAKGEHGQHPLFGRLTEKLGLTDKQKEDAKAIFQAAREEAKKATDREAKGKILKDAFEKVKTTVLTEEQRTKLAEMRKQRPHEMRGGQERRMHRGPEFGESLKRLGEKLGLTDKQKEDAKAILKAAHEANMKNLKDAFEKVKTTVLTDEQRAKLEKLGSEAVDKHLNRMGEKLGLTDKQKEDAKAIFKAAREEAKKATDHAAKMKIWKDAFEKVKTTVLDDAQRAKLKDRREGWREGPGRKGGKDKGGEGKGAGPAPAPAATSGK